MAQNAPIYGRLSMFKSGEAWGILLSKAISAIAVGVRPRKFQGKLLTSDMALRTAKRLHKRFSHRFDRRGEIKPNLEGERALVKQHRQTVGGSRPGFLRA